jgi:hypothetical protein
MFTIKASNLKPNPKNTRFAFGDLDVDNGLVISGCSFHQDGDHRWISFPSKPYERYGAKAYSQIIKFRDEEALRAFQRIAAQAVEELLHGK